MSARHRDVGDGGSMNGAAACVSRGTVSRDPQVQEPVRPFRRHQHVRTLETRRHREVERKLGDDGRFRAASVADDLERVSAWCRDPPLAIRSGLA
jgi:hypothetical protein